MRACEILTEMVIRAGTPENGSEVVAFGPYIWLFTQNEDERQAKRILRDIQKTTGLKADSLSDLYQARDDRPDILYGHIHDYRLWMGSADATQQFAITSPLALKVVQQLGLDGAGHSHFSGGDEWDADYARHQMVGNIPETVYHGTCTRYARDILRTGLRPTGNSNWGDLKFDGLIFLTANKELAAFHANKQAEQQRCAPVVIETRIPDRDLIGVDYDVANTFYGKSAKTTARGYDTAIERHARDWTTKQAKTIQKHNPKRDFTRATGTFSYRGRIAPAFFTAFYSTMSNEEMLGAPDGNAHVFEFRSRAEFFKALDMFETHEFYDPDYEPEEEEDYDDE